MSVRLSGRNRAKQGGTAGYDPVPAEMLGQVFLFSAPEMNGEYLFGSSIFI